MPFCLFFLQEQVNAVRVQTEDAIYALTNRFIKIAEKIGPENSSDVNDLLVSLQFADRTGQILDTVRYALEKIVEVTANPDQKIDVNAWREDLDKTYITVEQHQIHNGSTAGTANPDEEVSFF